MQLNRSYRQARQPKISSFMKKSPSIDFTQIFKKCEKKTNQHHSNQSNAKYRTRLYPFSRKTPSRSPSMKCTPTILKYRDNTSSKSPSPCTMLSHLDLTDLSNTNNSKKRKLEERDTSSKKTNCLKKVILSDGSVCYTMDSMEPTASASSPSQPPTKKMRPNSFQPQPSTEPLSQPPSKKRRATSGPIATKKAPPKQDNAKKTQDVGNTKRNKAIVYSESMPAPERPVAHDENMKKKRKRRHSHNEHWTSNNNLLQSLKEQEDISEEIFPSNCVNVNLEEMFNGQQFIRVHKKIRPINLRRETQMFVRPQI